MNRLVVKFFVACMTYSATLLLIAIPTHANTLATPYFNSLSVDDGLSQISVADIAEDNQGYLWLATQSGLDRFDGYTFRHFGKWQNSKSDGLNALTIFQIESSPSGEHLWLGTIAGVSRFSVADQTFEHFSLPITSQVKADVIKRILIDESGTVWVISGRSLYRFSTLNTKFVQVAILNDVTSTLTDIIIDNHNTIWLSATSGLYRLNSVYNSLELYAFQGVNISVMKLANDSSVWIGTASQGICRYPQFFTQTQSPSHCFTQKDGLVSNAVIGLLLQRNGHVWVATESGLHIIHGMNLDIVSAVSEAHTNLADERIISFYQTIEGLIVLGTRDKGFSIYNPNLAQFSTLPIGDNKKITGMSNGIDNSVWVTSEENLWRYRHQTQSVEGPFNAHPFAHTQPLANSVSTGSRPRDASPNKLLSVHYDRQFNTVWLATRGGLGRFTPGNTHVDMVGLEGKAGYSINVDSEGDVWYGGYSDGVFVYRPSEDRIIRQWPLSLTTRIVMESRESAWLASVSGLYFANKLTGELINVGEAHTQFPSNVVVTWMSRSIRGGFWIATQANGLFFMSLENDNIATARFTKIQENSLLNSLSLGAVIEDKQSGLWISNTEGLAYIPPEFNSVSLYGAQHGASEVGYYIGSALKTKDGTIMMGSPKGITQFVPEKIKQIPWSPKVHITAVDVFSHTAHSPENTPHQIADNTLTLDPQDISFSVEFTALDYASPTNVQYAYKLSDFDPDWRYTDYRRRIATYTNLDPGQYTLTVRAINKDGLSSSHQAQLTVSVIPAWWETALWRAAVVIVIVALVSLLVWWRISSLSRRSSVLAGMVEEKTRDLEDAVQKLTHLSSQDPLTGLKNRRYFTNRAQESWDRYERYAQPFSLMLVDIDWFKKFNDTYGHHVGDLILVKLAEILTINLRNSDVIARWGGEEFLILLPELNVHESCWVAEKLRTTVANTVFHCEGHDLKVTITVGVADIRESDSVEHCIHTVDKKLYKGKTSGRNAVVK